MIFFFFWPSSVFEVSPLWVDSGLEFFLGVPVSKMWLVGSLSDDFLVGRLPDPDDPIPKQPKHKLVFETNDSAWTAKSRRC